MRARLLLWVGLLALAAGRADAEALPGAPPMDPALAKRLGEAAAARPRDAVRTRHRAEDGAPRFTNRLVLEQSPYLLQHAHNPVDWHPWGDEAFALAKQLGRPVLVSIGYSTCHWCHVMEEESFDDLDTAKLLNESYVAIKVDREVRPDVDATYMASVSAFGRRGGWPLNVWLTPDRKPFHVGSYFPPADRGGEPGFPRVLAALAELYREQPDQVTSEAERAMDAIRAAFHGPTAPKPEAPGPETLTRALATYARRFDHEHGGMGNGAKFPGALPIDLMLHVHRSQGDAEALGLATRTLEAIARGGLHDHVGGGFHRYATDPAWRVPHFEKMLYDNANLLRAYVETWQATQRADFRALARRTGAWLVGAFEAPEGGYHSASDADSRGPDGELGEGLYYTWTREEMAAALGAEDAALAAEWYGVGEQPLLVGRSVLYTPRSLEATAAERGVDAEALAARLAGIRERLATARAERPEPFRDRKIVTAWNGLAISALARAGFALGEPAWVASAARAARQILGARDAEGRLQRVRLDGVASGSAFLEDYALVIMGLLDLYESEATADPAWLAAALSLQERLDADYADPAGGYFSTPAEAGALVRHKPVVDDGTLPAANGVAARNLLRLAALTGDDALRARAGKVFDAFQEPLTAVPAGVPTLLVALDWWQDVHQEVIVVLPEAGGDSAALLDVLRRVYQPNRVQAVVREGTSLADNAKWVSLVAGKRASKGAPTAYVCENRTCRFPTRDPAELERQLLREEVTR